VTRRSPGARSDAQAAGSASSAGLVLGEFRRMAAGPENTLRKLQLHNRVELVRYAIEQGLDGPAT
jgi:hypothetical protein